MGLAQHRIETRSGALLVAEGVGNGLPLLMIHGSGANMQVFARQFASALGEKFRLLALDLPGHGESPDADVSHYSVPALADAVADVLTGLRIPRLVVLGWSLGGHIGMDLIGRDDRIAGLMVVGAPPVGHGPLAMLRAFPASFDLLLTSKEKFSERDLLRFYQLCWHGEGDPRFLTALRRADGRVRPAVTRSMAQGAGADQRRAVELAQAPVAMVSGAADPFVRQAYVQSIAYGSLWDGRCHVIEGAGHAPFWDRPDLFNPLLMRFMDDVSGMLSARPTRLVRTA